MSENSDEKEEGMISDDEESEVNRREIKSAKVSRREKNLGSRDVEEKNYDSDNNATKKAESESDYDEHATNNRSDNEENESSSNKRPLQNRIMHRSPETKDGRGFDGVKYDEEVEEGQIPFSPKRGDGSSDKNSVKHRSRSSSKASKSGSSSRSRSRSRSRRYSRSRSRSGSRIRYRRSNSRSRTRSRSPYAGPVIKDFRRGRRGGYPQFSRFSRGRRPFRRGNFQKFHNYRRKEFSRSKSRSPRRRNYSGEKERDKRSMSLEDKKDPNPDMLNPSDIKQSQKRITQSFLAMLEEKQKKSKMIPLDSYKSNYSMDEGSQLGKTHGFVNTFNTVDAQDSQSKDTLNDELEKDGWQVIDDAESESDGKIKMDRFHERNDSSRSRSDRKIKKGSGDESSDVSNAKTKRKKKKRKRSPSESTDDSDKDIDEDEKKKKKDKKKKKKKKEVKKRKRNHSSTSSSSHESSKKKKKKKKRKSKTVDSDDEYNSDVDNDEMFKVNYDVGECKKEISSSESEQDDARKKDKRKKKKKRKMKAETSTASSESNTDNEKKKKKRKKKTKKKLSKRKKYETTTSSETESSDSSDSSSHKKQRKKKKKTKKNKKLKKGKDKKSTKQGKSKKSDEKKKKDKGNGKRSDDLDIFVSRDLTDDLFNSGVKYTKTLPSLIYGLNPKIKNDLSREERPYGFEYKDKDRCGGRDMRDYVREDTTRLKSEYERFLDELNTSKELKDFGDPFKLEEELREKLVRKMNESKDDVKSDKDEKYLTPSEKRAMEKAKKQNQKRMEEEEAVKLQEELSSAPLSTYYSTKKAKVEEADESDTNGTCQIQATDSENLNKYSKGEDISMILNERLPKNRDLTACENSNDKEEKNLTAKELLDMFKKKKGVDNQTDVKKVGGLSDKLSIIGKMRKSIKKSRFEPINPSDFEHKHALSDCNKVNLNADYGWYQQYYMTSYGLDAYAAAYYAQYVMLTCGDYSTPDLNVWFQQQGYTLNEHPVSENQQYNATQTDSNTDVCDTASEPNLNLAANITTTNATENNLHGNQTVDSTALEQGNKADVKKIEVIVCGSSNGDEKIKFKRVKNEDGEDKGEPVEDLEDIECRPPPKRPDMTTLTTTEPIHLPNGQMLPAGTKAVVVHPYPSSHPSSCNFTADAYYNAFYDNVSKNSNQTEANESIVS